MAGVYGIFMVQADLRKSFWVQAFTTGLSREQLGDHRYSFVFTSIYLGISPSLAVANMYSVFISKTRTCKYDAPS